MAEEAGQAAEIERAAKGAERLVFFSDAVVAIAMTLLVLPLTEIEPEGKPVLAVLGEHQNDRWAFAVSFFVIARYWAAHHRAFRLVRNHSDRLIGLNILWLASIVFLPFPS